jgi:hypothetical protein
MKTLLLAGCLLGMAAGDLSARPRPGKSFGPADEEAVQPVAQAAAEVTSLGVKTHQDGSYSQTLNFRMPGVYYLWIRASSGSEIPAGFRYSLDGEEQVAGNKGLVMVYPGAHSQWLSFSQHFRFKAQVLVEKPGRHTVTFEPAASNEKDHADGVKVERIAVTLSNLAQPQGEGLDESRDPSALKWSPYRSGAVGHLGNVDGWRPGAKPEALPDSGNRYFVDSTEGNDRADGRSEGKAWKSFRPLQEKNLQPGDEVLLKRGGSWDEPLAPRGQGERGLPIVVGAYGEGPLPRIQGGDQPAFHLTDQSHWVVQDLDLSDHGDAEASGLYVESTGGQTTQPSDVTIRRCVVRDSGGDGIEVGGGGARDQSRTGGHAESEGYDGVVIEDCLLAWNGGMGVAVHGTHQDGCKNTVIRHCTCYGNGSGGIIIHSGENGLIDHCLAYNNGWDGDGTVGIWCWNARNITIQYCESFRTSYYDGAGFDIDWGCLGSTIQYCYSHDNNNEGYLLMGSGTARFQGAPMQTRYCVARYNVSEGDGMSGGANAFIPCETFEDSWVYNNTAVARALSKSDGAPLELNGWDLAGSETNEPNSSGGWPARCRLVNNLLFLSGPGQAAMKIDEGSTKGHNLFDSNLFFAPQAVPASWSGKSFESMEGYRRSSGQDKNSLQADPKFAETFTGLPGRLPMDRLRPAASLQGQTIRLGSDWRKARLAVLPDKPSLKEIPWDIEDAKVDYSGKSLAERPSIGAFEIH